MPSIYILTGWDHRRKLSSFKWIVVIWTECETELEVWFSVVFDALAAVGRNCRLRWDIGYGEWITGSEVRFVCSDTIKAEIILRNKFSVLILCLEWFTRHQLIGKLQWLQKIQRRKLITVPVILQTIFLLHMSWPIRYLYK